MDESLTVYEVLINGLGEDSGWGVWVPQDSEEGRRIMASYPSKSIGTLKKTPLPISEVKEPAGYPPQFNLFWDKYHSSRRTEKKATYTAWKKLPPAVKADLPKCAEVATQKAVAQGKLQYLPHAVRFITKERYKEFLGAKTNPHLVTAIKYWDSCFQEIAEYPFPWDENLRTMAVEDIGRLGPKVWQEKVWIFFSGRDSGISTITRDKGYHYKIFHALLSGALLYSKVRRPENCRYCGGRDGEHHEGCPVIAKKVAEKKAAMEEIEAGKAAGLSLTAAFNKSIGRES